MATIEQLENAERKAMKLLEDAGLPLPDRVEYGKDLIRLIWWDEKIAFEVVDIG